MAESHKSSQREAGSSQTALGKKLPDLIATGAGERKGGNWNAGITTTVEQNEATEGWSEGLWLFHLYSKGIRLD